MHQQRPWSLLYLWTTNGSSAWPPGSTWPPARRYHSPQRPGAPQLQGIRGSRSGIVLTSCHLPESSDLVGGSGVWMAGRGRAARCGDHMGPPGSHSNVAQAPSTWHTVGTALTWACHPRNATSHPPPKVIDVLIPTNFCGWDEVRDLKGGDSAGFRQGCSARGQGPQEREPEGTLEPLEGGGRHKARGTSRGRLVPPEGESPGTGPPLGPPEGVSPANLERDWCGSWWVARLCWKI